MVVAHLFSVDAGPRQERQREDSEAGGPACKDRTSDGASRAIPVEGGQVGDGTGGEQSRGGPRAERAGRDVGKRGPVSRNGKNPPLEHGAKRQKGKGVSKEGNGKRNDRRKQGRTNGKASGKAKDDGPEFMRAMAGGQTLKTYGARIVLIEWEFGPATIDNVLVLLKAAYKLIERHGISA